MIYRQIIAELSISYCGIISFWKENMEGKLFKGLYCSGILGGSPLKELHPNEYSALENSRRIQPMQ